jgi:hypothetical protein
MLRQRWGLLVAIQHVISPRQPLTIMRIERAALRWVKQSKKFDADNGRWPELITGSGNHRFLTAPDAMSRRSDLNEQLSSSGLDR